MSQMLPPSSRWHNQKWRYGVGAAFASSIVLNFVLIGFVASHDHHGGIAGGSIRTIIHAMPDDVRSDFRNNMQIQRKKWRQDREAVRDELKGAAQKLSYELNAEQFNRLKIDGIFNNLQTSISNHGINAMEDMRDILIDALAQLPPEQRHEIARSLKEELENWD